MTRVALITTTINVPNNLIDWAKTMDPNQDIIVISGDLKSPHDEIQKLCEKITTDIGVPTRYIKNHNGPFNEWESGDVIGYNCIQRRNIALLEALTSRPEVIVTVDDDNYPIKIDQVDKYYKILTQRFDHNIVESESEWYNVGDAYSPYIIHRGFPLEHIHGDESKTVGRSPKLEVPIGVFSSLWIGDPDISALERILTDREVYGYEIVHDSIVLGLGTWCPFNSQATAFRAELSPLMMMWPAVGRFDDIWASYAMRAVMDYIGLYVQYGVPLVDQKRNPHNLIRDLKDEMFGYEHTLELTRAMRQLSFENKSKTHFDIISLAGQLYTHLCNTFPQMPRKTRNTFFAWIDDMRQLATAFGVNFGIKRIDSEV